MKTKGIIGWVVAIIALTNAFALAAPVDHIYISNQRVDKLNLDGSFDMNFIAPGIATICRQLSVDGNSGNVWIGCEGDNAVGLFSSAGAVINYVTGIGLAGGSCVDPFGNAWFTNNVANTVIKFGQSGNLINSYPVGANSPIAVACDRLGNVWTANISANNVSKLANNGTFIGTYAVSNSPRGIAVDAQDNIWVVTNAGYVEKLDFNGNRIGHYGSGNVYGYGIAIDPNGDLWTTQPFFSNLVKMSSNGNILGTFVSGGGCQDVTIDASGNVWTIQRTLSTITKLSNNGAIFGTSPLSGNSGQNDTGFLHQRFVLGYNSVDGPNVWVPFNGGAPAGAVTLNFDYITTKGNSSYTESNTGTAAPTGFKLGTPNHYYDITSTANYTGNIQVCIGYVETEFTNEASLKLFHYAGTWTDVTSSLDTTNNIICGDVTGLSEFAIMEPTGEGPIPTVSEWMLILMAVFLFVAIVRRLKPSPIRA